MDTDQENGSIVAESQENGPVPADQALAEGAAFLAGDDPGAVVAANGSAPPPIEFAAKTLTGDLRDLLLDELRQLREPWHKLSERQQEIIAERVYGRSVEAVAELVNVIGARSFPFVDALVEEIRFKEKGCDLKLALSGMSRENRHAVVDARGTRIMLVIADSLYFHGARGPAKIDRQALFDAPPAAKDEPEGEASGPLFAEPDLEARATGEADGFAGVRDHAARYPQGEAGHGDYELGWNAGAERRQDLAEARQVDAGEDDAEPEPEQLTEQPRRRRRPAANGEAVQP